MKLKGKIRVPILLLICALYLLSIGAVAVAQDGSDPEEDGEGTPRDVSEVQLLLRGEGQNDGERIVVEVDPGESSSIQIDIGNAGETPIAVFTFTSDVSTRLNGGLQMGEEGSEQHEPTTWIDYPTEHFDLDPQSLVSRDAVVTVPEDAVPGEHVIPIAVETVDAFEVEGAANLLQKVRKILTLYVVVPGDVQPGFEFGDPRIEYGDRRAAIWVPLTNTAQTSLRLYGEIKLEDSTGVVVLDEQVVMGTIYGLDETSVYHPLLTPLPPGEYLLTLQLLDNASGVTNGFERVTVVMPEPPSDEVVPLTFGEVVIAPNADPIQFAAVGVEIVNNAQTITSGRLVMIVSKDGEPLEEFSLAENLTIEQGTTSVVQRYLPLTGWETGEYTFALRLESVNSDGNASVLLTLDDAGTIEVP